MEPSIIKLIMEKGPRMGETLEFKQRSSIRIGRVVKGNTLPIKDPGISSKHSKIEYDSGRWVVTDLDSSNGTCLNSSQLLPLTPSEIWDGDELKIGEYTSIRIKLVDAPDGSQLCRNPRRGASVRHKADEIGINERSNSVNKELLMDDVKSARGPDLKDVSKPKTRVRGRGRPRKANVLMEERSADGLGDAKENLNYLDILEKPQNIRNFGGPATASADDDRALVLPTNLENLGVLGTSGDLEAARKLANPENLAPKQSGAPNQKRARSSKRKCDALPGEGLMNMSGAVVKPSLRRSTRRTNGTKTQDNTESSSSVLDKISEDPDFTAHELNGQDKIGLVEKAKGQAGRGRKRNVQANSQQNVGFGEERNEENLIARDGIANDASQRIENSIAELCPQKSCGMSGDVAVLDNKAVEECNVGETFRIPEDSNIGEASECLAAQACGNEQETEAGNGLDLEKATLGEWFDFLEICFLKQIHSAKDEIIADMRKRSREFHDVLLKQPPN